MTEARGANRSLQLRGFKFVNSGGGEVYVGQGEVFNSCVLVFFEKEKEHPLWGGGGDKHY